MVQDVGSQVIVSINGQPLEKFKEYKLAVGQVLKIGDDAVYQVSAQLNASSLSWHMTMSAAFAANVD